MGEYGEPNDIDATGHCCCNGCIGEGLCDLEIGGGRDDDLDEEYDDYDDYGSGDLAYEGSW